jgi:cation diffusion facilitator family transporter
MHIKTLDSWKHKHDFTVIHEKGERRTTQVLILTAVTMGIEIIAGAAFGSMALLADGWHMGTHVAAFMITLFAYRYAKRHKKNPLFTFGTGKVSVLGGFASAVALIVIALVMGLESIQRIVDPQEIRFNEAILVALLGLTVNLVSAFLLQERPDHDGGDSTHHCNHDHNLKAAYLHVLADALTSVLAVAALFSGKIFGWNRLDPAMGIVGAFIIVRWALGLLKDASPILLDKTVEEMNHAKVREIIEADSDNRISDLHVWRVGPEDYAVIVSLVTHFPKPVEYYKRLLKDVHKLSHITVEVNQCLSEPCILPGTDTF